MQDVTSGHLRQKLCASGAIGDIAAREHEEAIRTDAQLSSYAQLAVDFVETLPPK
jgi:hypothetical protein